MAFRLDVAGKGKGFKRTPQGGIRSDAYLTRAGVFTYHVGDGKGGTREFKELRHPDEVFHPDSLATLAGAAVTIDHPRESVSPANWSRLAVGHVGDDVKADGKFVAAQVRVQDAGAVAAVEAEKLVEFSCGYTCDVHLEKGIYDGIEYDGVQKNIRYNHVGMGPRNWGRAGTEVRLRADGASEDVAVSVCDSPYSLGMTEAELRALNERLQAERDAAAKRADAAEAKVADLEKIRSDAAASTAKLETVTAERDAASKRADAAEASIVTRVADRVSLIGAALPVLGADFKADGLSDRDLRIAAIVKVDPDFKADGRSDDYVAGMFSAIVPRVKVADASLGALRVAADKADDAKSTEKSKLDSVIDEVSALTPAWKTQNVVR